MEDEKKKRKKSIRVNAVCVKWRRRSSGDASAGRAGLTMKGHTECSPSLSPQYGLFLKSITGLGVSSFISLTPETLVTGIPPPVGPLVLHANDSAPVDDSVADPSLGSEVSGDPVLLLMPVMLLLSGVAPDVNDDVNGRSVVEAVTSVRLMAVVTEGRVIGWGEEIDSFLPLVSLAFVCKTGSPLVVTSVTVSIVAPFASSFLVTIETGISSELVL